MATTKVKDKPVLGKEDGKAAGKSITVDSTAAPVKKKQAPKKPRVKKNVDLNRYVTVKNGFNGPLIYIDKTTGEEHSWGEFGDEVDMTVGSLQRARSSQKRFFEDNWWLFDDPEVIEFLHAEQWYKNALSYEEFDTVFDGTIKDIEEIVGALSVGQKLAVSFCAKKKIKSGELSDLNLIKSLEKILNTELIY